MNNVLDTSTDSIDSPAKNNLDFSGVEQTINRLGKDFSPNGYAAEFVDSVITTLHICGNAQSQLTHYQANPDLHVFNPPEHIQGRPLIEGRRILDAEMLAKEKVVAEIKAEAKNGLSILAVYPESLAEYPLATPPFYLEDMFRYVVGSKREKEAIAPVIKELATDRNGLDRRYANNLWLYAIGLRFPNSRDSDFTRGITNAMASRNAALPTEHTPEIHRPNHLINRFRAEVDRYEIARRNVSTAEAHSGKLSNDQVKALDRSKGMVGQFEAGIQYGSKVVGAISTEFGKRPMDIPPHYLMRDLYIWYRQQGLMTDELGRLEFMASVADLAPEKVALAIAYAEASALQSVLERERDKLTKNQGLKGLEPYIKALNLQRSAWGIAFDLHKIGQTTEESQENVKQSVFEHLGRSGRRAAAASLIGFLLLTPRFGRSVQASRVVARPAIQTVSIKQPERIITPEQARREVLRLAKSQIGARYDFGSMNPKGPAGGPGAAFDCSGLTKWVLGQEGIDTIHMARLQQQQFVPVKREDLRDGDLVLFWFPNHRGIPEGQASHIGINMGKGWMIAAGSDGVEKQPILWQNYIGAVDPFAKWDQHHHTHEPARNSAKPNNAAGSSEPAASANTNVPPVSADQLPMPSLATTPTLSDAYVVPPAEPTSAVPVVDFKIDYSKLTPSADLNEAVTSGAVSVDIISGQNVQPVTDPAAVQAVIGGSVTDEIAGVFYPASFTTNEPLYTGNDQSGVASDTYVTPPTAPSDSSQITSAPAPTQPPTSSDSGSTQPQPAPSPNQSSNDSGDEKQPKNGIPEALKNNPYLGLSKSEARQVAMGFKLNPTPDDPYGVLNLNSKKGKDAFVLASILAGTPLDWYGSSGERNVLRVESGDRVGVPNYTIAGHEDPSRWPDIIRKAQIGVEPGGPSVADELHAASSAIGLGQPIESVLTAQAAKMGVDPANVYGNAVLELGVNLGYEHDKYGNPDVAWGNHSANPHRWEGVPKIYDLQGY